MTKKRCLLIGAAPDTDIKVISRLLRDDDHIVCADGGYKYAEMLGIKPQLIVGDFDSSEKPKDIACDIISLPVRKDDTDMLYAVKECIRRGCDEFVICGATGGRLDHTYANFCVLKYLAERNIPACIADGSAEIRVLCGGEFDVEGRNGCGFGIFPFGCGECTVSLSGFEYNLDCGTLTADFPLGVSNTVRSDKAVVTVHGGSAIIMYYYDT